MVKTVTLLFITLCGTLLAIIETLSDVNGIKWWQNLRFFCSGDYINNKCFTQQNRWKK